MAKECNIFSVHFLKNKPKSTLYIHIIHRHTMASYRIDSTERSNRQLGPGPIRLNLVYPHLHQETGPQAVIDGEHLHFGVTHSFLSDSQLVWVSIHRPPEHKYRLDLIMASSLTDVILEQGFVLESAE